MNPFVEQTLTTLKAKIFTIDIIKSVMINGDFNVGIHFVTVSVFPTVVAERLYIF